MFLFRYLAAVLIIPFAFAGQKAEGNKSGGPAQVLFVCEHGAAKSLIAATYFNKLARERGFPQQAIARGTQPDPAYSPSVVQGLKGDGLEIAKGRPILVTDVDIAAATYVVTLGCKLPRPVVRQKFRGTLNSRPQQFAVNATTLKGRYTSSILTFRDEFVTSGPMECKLLILRCLTRFE